MVAAFEHPLLPGGGYPSRSALSRFAMVSIPGPVPVTRQEKICSTTGAVTGSRDEAGLGAALGGFGRDGVRGPVRLVAVGGVSVVVPGEGVLG